MSYLFTNPEVKRWKTLFLISLFLNIILGVALYVGIHEVPPPADIPPPVVPEDPADPVEPVPARQTEPAVGAPLPVWLTITSNFYETFTGDPTIARYAEMYDFPRLAEILSVQISRLLMWDLVLRKEVQKNDTLSFVFRMIPSEELKQRTDLPDSLEVLAVSYFSNRYNKFIDLYAYRPANSAYQRYFYGDGRSLEKQLQARPIEDHVQILNFFKETPPYDGIDFKAPTGTPVYATFDGRISRTNWQTRFNGYSVEVTAKNGLHTAQYLHLSEVLVTTGQEVRGGDLIAKSGNTGKAPTPHLHYQIITGGRKGRPIDPFIHHGAAYTYLKGDELGKFQEIVVDYRTLLKKVADK